MLKLHSDTAELRGKTADRVERHERLTGIIWSAFFWLVIFMRRFNYGDRLASCRQPKRRSQGVGRVWIPTSPEMSVRTQKADSLLERFSSKRIKN